MADYLQSIYEPVRLTDDLSPNSFPHPSWRQHLAFMWHHAPDSLTSQFRSARNTTIHWPPKQNEKYPLVAFPYPAKDPGAGEVVNFIRGMLSILNSKHDAATVPAFYISLYDPEGEYDSRLHAQTVNHHSYSTALREAFYRSFTPLHLLDPYRPDAGGVIEVMHSCYPPSGAVYPYCDDGGYWFYGTAGSGVFWKIPSKDEGALQSATQPPSAYASSLPTSQPVPRGCGTLLCANKVDALLRLYAFRSGKLSLYRARDDAHIFYNPQHNPHLHDILAGGAEFLAGTGGGRSDVVAMFNGVHEYQTGKIIDITAFRVMTPSDGTIPTCVYLFFLVLLLSSLAVYVLIGLPGTVYQGKRGTATWKRVLSENMAFVVGWIALLFIFTFVLTSMLFRGFGYVTLDVLQKETGFSVSEIMLHAAKGTHSACNGLPMSQIFDLPIEKMAINVPAYNVKNPSHHLTSTNANTPAPGVTNNTFACIIMHTQPNKMGVWTCEIVDFTKTPFVKGFDIPLAQLGLCGATGSGVAGKGYVYKSGVHPDAHYPVQQPEYFDKLPACDCSQATESLVAQISPSGNPPSGLFCKGKLSETLCVQAAMQP